MKTDLLLLLLYWRRYRRRSNRLHHGFINKCSEQDNDDSNMLLMLLWEKRKFVHSRNRKAFYNTLSRIDKNLRQRKIPRSCLFYANSSAWRKLYAGRNDGALITFTGLNHKVFDELHKKFDPLYQRYTPHSSDGIIREKKMTGRKRTFSSMDCLALSLAWTRTRGSMYVLQIIFGMTAASVSLYLRFGRRLLVQILRKEKEARVEIPSDEKIQEFKDSIKKRHLTLNLKVATTS